MPILATFFPESAKRSPSLRKITPLVKEQRAILHLEIRPSEK
jgi:hypothetical protein